MTVTLSLEEFNSTKKNSYQEGFNKGTEVLLSLIELYLKSGLTPKAYVESLYPRLPNPCLYKYFYLINEGWLTNDGVA